jgi:hypothetical protein
MAKKKSPRRAAAVDAADLPVVGPREPCPCGSGKKYKVCHGRAAARAARQLVARPFEGLPGECDWIAMREMVPAATASVRLIGDHAGQDVTVATLLPGAAPALVRADGEVLLGLQTRTSSGDASRDLADVLLRALQAGPGSQIGVLDLPGPGPRLQDLLDLAAPFEVTIHSGFDFWLGGQEVQGDLQAALDRANESLVPTARLAGVEAAYWVRIGSKEHLRWVLPFGEDDVLDGFARLHAAGADTVGDGSRFIGSFRAHGLLVPVWDLAPGTEPDEVEEPAAEYLVRLQDAMASGEPLTAEERAAKAGLQNRQLTLR